MSLGKINNKIYRCIRCAILIAVIFLPHSYSDAATFVFTQNTTATMYTVGDTISIGIYVNTATEAINAISAKIQYPQSQLRLDTISKTATAIDFWTIGPYRENGVVALEGIVLNPGITESGLVATLQFTVIGEGQAKLLFLDGAILANDGKATNMLTSLPELIFDIKPLLSDEETQPVVEEMPVVVAVPVPEENIPFVDTIQIQYHLNPYYILLFVLGTLFLVILLLLWYLRHRKNKADYIKDTFQT